MKRKAAFTVIMVSLIGGGCGIASRLPKTMMSFIDIGTHHAPPSFVEVHKTHVYKQTFVPHYDELTGVSVFISNQALEKDDEIIFEIETPSALRRIVTPMRDIRPLRHDFFAIPPDAEITSAGFHYHLRFDSIHKAKNKIFALRIKAPKTPRGKGLKVGAWPRGNNHGYYEALTNGSLYQNHHLLSGALAFRTYHTFTQSFTTTFNQIKSRLLQDKAFLIVYAACLALLFLLIMKNAVSARR